MKALDLILQPLFGVEVQTFNSPESGFVILNVRSIPARRWTFGLRGVNSRTSLCADDPAETSWAGISGARTRGVCLAPHQCVTAARNSSSPRGTAWSPQEHGTGQLHGQAWASIHTDNMTKQQNEKYVYPLLKVLSTRHLIYYCCEQEHNKLTYSTSTPIEYIFHHLSKMSYIEDWSGFPS